MLPFTLSLCKGYNQESYEEGKLTIVRSGEQRREENGK